MQGRLEMVQRIRVLVAAALVVLLAAVGTGAFWFFQVVDELGRDARTEVQGLLQAEDSVSDGISALAGQTQAWKDLLLRHHDPVLRAKYRQELEQFHVKLNADLLRARQLAEGLGISPAQLDALLKQEKSLIQSYTAAAERLDPALPLSYRDADSLVIGQDRALRAGLWQLRDAFDRMSLQHVARLGIAQGGRRAPYYLLGGLAVLLPLALSVLFFFIYRQLRAIGRGDARVRAIHESIGDAVVVADAQGRIESLNAAAEQLTGWRNQEACGRTVHEVIRIFDLATRQRVECPIEAVLRQGAAKPLSNGMFLLGRDGRERVIEDSAMPVRNEGGGLQGAVMVMHDVTQRYALLKEVRFERALFRQTFDLAQVGMAHLAPDGRWLRVNRKLCAITGYSEGELLALSFQGITHADDLEHDLAALHELMAGRRDSYQTEKRYVRKDGATVWVALHVAVVRKPDGAPDYGIAIIEDIQGRKDAESSAQAAQERYRELFEQMPEGVLLIGSDMKVQSCNGEAMRQLGYGYDELLQLHVWDIDAVEDQALVAARVQKLHQTGHDEFESRYRTRGGGLIEVAVSVRLAQLPDGAEVFQCLFRNIGEQKQAARQIEHLAYHDQLTGLANRRLLQDRLAQAVNSVLRRNAQLALLYLDLDHFKDVNDSLGHQVGDRLLSIVAERLRSCMRAEDTLARVGGDEFVVMMNDVEDSEAAASVAQKIIEAVRQPLSVADHEIRVTPSVGISVCPQDGKDAETLLKNADAALYLAKRQGRATYRFYTEDLHRHAVARLKMERLLHLALVAGEFEMYYQPKMDLLDGGVIGCEALIRWKHDGGMVSPAEFIPVAEQSNLIVEIGAWVMREVCRQTAAWQRQGLCLRVAFNVSARQFMRPMELLNTLRDAIRTSGVDASGLEIEMTESLLLDEGRMQDVLGEIRAMGVHLTLDDFGTGYSSLSYLRKFPLDTMKIDRSFVSDADHDPDDAAMVKTIIGMARNLRLGLVAEGIETEAQRALLAAHGCQHGQGYHFSRPLPVAEFEAFLRAQPGA